MLISIPLSSLGKPMTLSWMYSPRTAGELPCSLSSRSLVRSFMNKSLLDALWPRSTPQRECAMGLLQRMENEGIIPEASTYHVALKASAAPNRSKLLTAHHQTFGRASGPVMKIRRMAYWMRRFFFANPFAVPKDLSDDPREVCRPAVTTAHDLQAAKVVVKRIGRRNSVVLGLFYFGCAVLIRLDCSNDAKPGDYLVAAHTPVQTTLADELPRYGACTGTVN